MKTLVPIVSTEQGIKNRRDGEIEINRLARKLRNADELMTAIIDNDLKLPANDDMKEAV